MLSRLLGQGALSQRIGHAGIWTVIGFGSNNGLRLVSNLALTRLLSPEIFGLMALAQVFMNGIAMLSDIGVRASVIRSPRGDDPRFLQTAWTMQIIRGVFVSALCCLIAWPVSLAYGEGILFPLICALALTAFISGFQSISIARVNRKLMVKGLTIMSLISRVLTLAVTIFLAWQWQSVWALAVGAIVGSVINVVLSFVILTRFDHRLVLEREAAREILLFGRWILLATFFTFLGARGQQAMFGLVVPVEVIGLIAIATLLSSIPTQLFTKLLNTVLFPSFAELMRERSQDLPRALRKVRIFIICLAFPMLFSISFLAQPIVDFLYDDRYQMAGLILALMALNAAVPLLSGSYQNLFLTEGRSDLHALLMFLWASSTTLAIFLGFSFFGLVGSLVGIGVATSIMFFINLKIALKRGYATWMLDVVAWSIVVLFYLGTLWTMEIPDALLSPDLIGRVFSERETS